MKLQLAVPENWCYTQFFGTGMCLARTFLCKQGFAVRKNFGLQQFLAQQYPAGVRSARTMHPTSSSRASAARFAYRVCKSGAPHTALTRRVCMKYISPAKYTVSSLSVALCSCSVHCQCIHLCTVHVLCTLSVHPVGHTTTTVYTVSAMCTCGVHCTCSQCCNLHWQWTIQVHISILCAPTVYTARTVNSALGTSIVKYQFTHRCTVPMQCSVQMHISILSEPSVHTVRTVTGALCTSSAYYKFTHYCTVIYCVQSKCTHWSRWYKIGIPTCSLSAPVLQSTLHQCSVELVVILSEN